MIWFMYNIYAPIFMGFTTGVMCLVILRVFQ